MGVLNQTWAPCKVSAVACVLLLATMSRSDLVVTTTGGMWGRVRVVENPRMTTTTAEDVDMRGVIDVSVFVFGAIF